MDEKDKIIKKLKEEVSGWKSGHRKLRLQMLYSINRIIVKEIEKEYNLTNINQDIED